MISVRTVDGAQGCSADLVILDIVQTFRPGFTVNRNRICLTLPPCYPPHLPSPPRRSNLARRLAALLLRRTRSPNRLQRSPPQWLRPISRLNRYVNIFSVNWSVLSLCLPSTCTCLWGSMSLDYVEWRCRVVAIWPRSCTLVILYLLISASSAPTLIFQISSSKPHLLNLIF
jgi:hypothetical protein